MLEKSLVTEFIILGVFLGDRQVRTEISVFCVQRETLQK